MAARIPLFDRRREPHLQQMQDNGCVAELNGEASRRRFRFVGAFKGAALFQHDTHAGPRLWVGNPFYADDERLRLTMVADGLAPGERPFMEIQRNS